MAGNVVAIANVGYKQIFFLLSIFDTNCRKITATSPVNKQKHYNFILKCIWILGFELNGMLPKKVFIILL